MRHAGKIAVIPSLLVACLAGAELGEWSAGALGSSCQDQFCTPPVLVANDCIGRARRCATAQMNAADGPADVRGTFEECLRATSIEMPAGPAACDAACQGNQPSCDGVVSALEALSAHPPCAWHLADCMRTCAERGEDLHESDGWAGTSPSEQPEALCLDGCGAYATARQRCGGPLDRPSRDQESCLVLCEATTGPWANGRACQEQCDGIDWRDGELAWEATRHDSPCAIEIPEGIAAMRVRVEPVAIVRVWAPGQPRTQPATCVSGDGDPCVVRPLARASSLTPGAWAIEVEPPVGDSPGSSSEEIELEVELGRSPVTGAEQE